MHRREHVYVYILFNTLEKVIWLMETTILFFILLLKNPERGVAAMTSQLMRQRKIRRFVRACPARG